MQHEIKGYRLTLIDEPLQSHVVAWEQAARSLKNQDAKPVLNRVMAELKAVRISDNPASLIHVFHMVFESLETALSIINNNETLTLSANHGVMVKAAIKAGWIVSVEQLSEVEGAVPQIIIGTEEEVDQTRPPWLVSWVAEKVAQLYMEATTIPKN